MTRRSAFAAALLTVAAAAGAQPVDPKLPLWEILVGAGGVVTPAYPGSQDRSSRALVLPYLIYRGKVLRSDQSGIAARLLRTDKAEFDIGFAASLPARSEDVAARAGMPNLGTLVEFGPRLKYKITRPAPDSGWRFELPLRAVIEVRSGLRRQGWTLEPKLVYEARDAHDVWNIDTSASVVLGDDGINDYFYEVRPQFATPERSAYSAKAGLLLMRAGVFAARKLNPDLRVFGFVRYESYANAANRDSPLMLKRTGASAGIGMAWTLRRSTRLARE